MTSLNITSILPDGMTIKAPINEAFQDILTTEALQFIKELHNSFNFQREALLSARQEIQTKIDKGWRPEFLKETIDLRKEDWQIAPIPKDILDRRVEITGPVDRKMIINALNSGANVFMADFEDSNAPTWENTISGQINLKDAIRKTIEFENPNNGKKYSLNEKTATLFVRPRGWHLVDKTIEINGEPVSASVLDFGLYFFHNAKYLIENGSGPYFYLPKLEDHKEARLWNDVFIFSQNYLEIPLGTIKATVLVETILAPFQLHEILWELRQHSAGMNCGRWDYIFSFIKKFRNVPEYVFPDRAQVNMTAPFMRAYTQLVIQTCHKRGAHAIGGMAAQIPIKNNIDANTLAMEKVKADKFREVTDGHDGTWVAHPAMVPLAKEIFDAHLKTPNQIHVKREDFSCSDKDLIQIPIGTITEEGLSHNINVGILYIESWLSGNGAVAIYNLMEDAATAEICRAQVWQWIHSNAKLEDGRSVNESLYQELKNIEIEKIKVDIGLENFEKGNFLEAIQLFNQLVFNKEWVDFLTLPAYDLLISKEIKNTFINQ